MLPASCAPQIRLPCAHRPFALADYLSPSGGSKRGQGGFTSPLQLPIPPRRSVGPAITSHLAKAPNLPTRAQAVDARPSRCTPSPATSRRAPAADRSCRSRPRTRRSSGHRRSRMARSGSARRGRPRWAPRRSPSGAATEPRSARGTATLSTARAAAAAAQDPGPSTKCPLPAALPCAQDRQLQHLWHARQLPQVAQGRGHAGAQALQPGRQQAGECCRGSGALRCQRSALAAQQHRRRAVF
jgi:hypothetical protein